MASSHPVGFHITCIESPLTPSQSTLVSVEAPGNRSCFDRVCIVLKRVYGADVLAKHKIGQTISAVIFAGTLTGMLGFGMENCPLTLHKY